MPNKQLIEVANFFRPLRHISALILREGDKYSIIDRNGYSTINGPEDSAALKAAKKFKVQTLKESVKMTTFKHEGRTYKIDAAGQIYYGLIPIDNPGDDLRYNGALAIKNCECMECEVIELDNFR